MSTAPATQDELFQYVYAWLKKKYKSRQIPHFEVTPRTLSVLYSLAQLNEGRDSDAEAIIQECEQRTKEFNAEASRLQNVLQAAHLTVNHGNPQSLLNACVETLASIALTLGIKDTQTSSYYIAINNLKLEMDSVASRRASEQQLMSAVILKTQQALQRLSKLRSVMEQLEEKAAKGRHTNHVRQGEISYMTTKRAEYEQEVQDFNKQMEVEEVDLTNYSHSVLVRSAEQLNQLQAMTDKVNEVLSSYMDLPPNVGLAKLKIDSAKEQLANLEEKLSAQLNGIL